MAPFKMCKDCQREYDDPEDRRFHAQPNACPVCGPQLFLLDENGSDLAVKDVIKEACILLKKGKILAIKGLGGYHLACDARNEEAVSNLRSRKYREYKPFAVMAQDVETVKMFCQVNEEEAKSLNGTIRPIVLLNKNPDESLAKGVAPNQKYHGVMLPYTPLHHIIVSESGLILVMTSGNISSEPIVYQDNDGLKRLNGIADYYLIHNREIHIRTDDSVCRIVEGKEELLRRSRGYAPFPLILPEKSVNRILAVGGELKNTFCLTRDQFVFMSHHIGDLENLETLTSFEQGIEHFKRIFNITPSYIAHDLHPEYLSTKYAMFQKTLPKISVQHHHAHIASCMGENSLDGEVIGVSFDGTGFGTDGNIWGGEFLVCSKLEFKRMAHFEYLPLPGGEKAITEPWRIALSALKKSYQKKIPELPIEWLHTVDKQTLQIMDQMIEKKINSPLTSSAGRIFDAVSALIGIRKEIYYEGQAAIELEMAAAGDEAGCYPYELTPKNELTEIVLSPLFKSIVRDIKEKISVNRIASMFHNTMADIIFNMCCEIKRQNGMDRIVLSGGVFQNMRLLTQTVDLLKKEGFHIFTHSKVPPNDGGLALGQALIANEQIKKGLR